MGLVSRLHNIETVKFSFGKNDEFHQDFSKSINALSMHDSQESYGLDIPKNLSSGNQLMGVFREMNLRNGIFVFNINGVDLHKAKEGFLDGFEEASNNNNITEWELSIILQNEDYLNNTIFHNGKVEFINEKEELKILWN